MRKIVVALSVVALSVVALLAGTSAMAAPCKDAKGKFTKCPPAAAKVTAGVTKDKNGKCHLPNGKFTACPK